MIFTRLLTLALMAMIATQQPGLAFVMAAFYILYLMSSTTF